MQAIDSSHDLYAVGQLAAHMQRSVGQITRAAEALEIAPAFRINGVPHFDASQVDQLTDYFRKQPQ